MKKLFVIGLFLSCFIAITKAQESKSVSDYGQEDDELHKTTYYVNRVQDNWFITLSGGVADLMSEESNYVSFGDRVAPAFGLSLGKWISPYWGLRVNFTGAKLHGFATWNDDYNIGLGSWYIGKSHPYPGLANTNSYLPAYEGGDQGQFIKDRFLKDPISTKSGDGYNYEVPYFAGSIDFLWNIANTFCGYDNERLVNPILYGGVGLAHTIEDSEKGKTAVNSIMEKFGLMVDFRLSDAFSVNIDGQFLIVPEIFDWRVGDGNTQDVVGNYTVGVTYKFQKRNFQAAFVKKSSEMSYLNEKVNKMHVGRE